ncbi:MAG TPA: hypothetical protein VM578_03415 [Candidatus Saccharimonadales bacterium]|nr:hypothetical protein [Candidatus Saccharimonadales bacterium]
MSASRTVTSAATVSPACKQAEGAFVDVHGERFYCITDYDAMPPFFMSIVSHSDHYLFISSNGGLTAGRKDPDHTLFPYYNDDRIHASHESTGSKTIFRVQTHAATAVWEPFSVRSQDHTGDPGSATTRNLYKSVYGNKIIFEEINHALGLSFSYEWAISDRFGFVRTSRLTNRKSVSQSVEVVDGLQNLMPSGVTRRFQLEYSTLVDGYKRTELEPETGLAMFQLTSLPVDRPEPSESLRTNVAWSVGLDFPVRLLSRAQLDSFRYGHELTEEVDVHGQPGAYFVSASMELAPVAVREWKIVSDVNQDAAGVRSLLRVLRCEKNLAAKVSEDVALGTDSLVRLVASSDGLQQTGDEASTWHHFASTLFNVMRGGIPDDGYWITREDFATFAEEINRPVARSHQSFLASLPDKLLHHELLSLAHAENDPDLERITHEYLPLTFSRRHGDPSRPWNIFNIRVKDEQGNKILNYQGNWRDIFQNWEALTYSYPGFAVSMIFKFLDSSTPDGYNPYRITRDGYDWEVLDPHDPWSCIGYWGDHQVVYLLRLLEQAQRHDPEALPRLLTREVFSFANVPYRIRPYSDLLRDSQKTIVFDFDAHRKAMEDAEKIGADGKALADAGGQIIRANLSEKLLILLLAKLSNFVPDAGIWMNTQRPEWNDANNALVGAGTSMVTLYYLRRFMVFVRDLFLGSGMNQVSVATEVADLFESMRIALERYPSSGELLMSDVERKSILDALGEASSQYRQQIYAKGFSKGQRSISVSTLAGFFDVALRHIDSSIRANRRSDGLYHAYNLIELDNDELHIHNLPLMLEGQVAVLSSGALSAHEAIQLLNALRESPLYREDQNSYILYPYKTLPSFLDKNNIPAEAIAQSNLLSTMIARGDQRVVVRDLDGGFHFNSAINNVSALRAMLADIKEPDLAGRVQQEANQICDVYEDVFQHRFFTGRSGSFYKYEGIGCIYWHMVSKLLLAVREVLSDAVHDGVDESLLSQLRSHYNNIRAGLGTHKPPSIYGAVPTDPYSHTPGFAGAQQPGMTGQVKEDFISRVGEMGVEVRSGEIRFSNQLITSDEFLDEPGAFEYWDVNGNRQRSALHPGTLAFTFCQVPIIAHREGPQQIVVTFSDGSEQTISGCKLDTSMSQSIFQRTGVIQRLEVFFACPHNKLVQ